MFCRYCGNNLPDNAVFCNRCGKRQDVSGGQVMPPFPIAPTIPGAYPAGNVPVVQGTPQVGNVPLVQGTPPQPVNPFAQSAAHGAGNAASPYAPQPALPHQSAGQQAPSYTPPQPHMPAHDRQHGVHHSQPHMPTHDAQHRVHHARSHKIRHAGRFSHAAIVTVTVAVVVIVGGSLAWVYAHNQQPSPPGSNTFIPATTPTPTPSPAVHNLVVNAAQDSPGLDTGIDLVAGSTLTITAQGTAAYGVSGSSCPEETNPDGSIAGGGGTCSPDMDPSATLPSVPVGVLLASIGQPGTSSSSGWFAVGSHYAQKVSSGGRLFLIYNDDPGQYGNNSGSYQVTVTITAS